jgi:uncharacterized membrane protein
MHAIRLARPARLTAACGIVLACLSSPARADLHLCNRTSYVVDTAIGVEVKGSAATRGWLRVDPGQCKVVLQGAIELDHVYVHVRALPLYGTSPLALSGHVDMCISEGNFIIPGARNCETRQRLVRFTEVRPTDTEDGPTANLAEEADYSREQARLAGIQRLLVLAGYDASPIDGIEGKKTEVALSQFLKDRGLAPDAAAAPSIFDALMGAAKQMDAAGFGWCNETSHTVMAALGLEEKEGIVTRGWYRIEAGSCLKPEIDGAPRHLYSYAEAVDAAGTTIQQASKPLAWGGGKVLCTRNLSFELAEQNDCAGRGLTSAGFAMIDLTGRRGATVRFKEP